MYPYFIKENVAIKGANRIGIYDENGNRVGQIPLGNLSIPKRRKLYSFGAISDVHIGYNTAESDFANALSYLNSVEQVAFTCVCGDLTQNGSEAHLQKYREIVENYSSNAQVYSIPGNHELYSTKSRDYYTNHIGTSEYFTFAHDDDVFIMLGTYGNNDDEAFSMESLQFLYETLEANRNKRCFVFQHIFPTGDGVETSAELYYLSGSGVNDIFGAKGQIFKSLLRHYKNTIFFHGHSHLRFSLQEQGENLNYDEVQGFRSVHIPSLSAPRIETMQQIYADSEGYLVDVYKNAIHLRGIDFVNSKYLPIASYWIDTTLEEVEKGTYVDETGTILTN